MATKKPAPKATKAETTEKAPKAAKPLKTASAKAEAKPAKAPAKAVKAPAKGDAKVEAKAPAPKKAPAKPSAKADPKAAAKKAPKTVEAVAAPLIPEAVEAPAPRPAPKGRKGAAAPAPEAVPAGPPTLTPHAATVLAAIGAGQAVELIFLDEAANPPRTFEPRRLIFDVFSRAWFAWGWDRRYNAERHHRLDHLKEVNPVEGPGRAAQGPYKDGTPANQIGGWLGGEPIPVKALLMKQWIFAVKQAPAPFPDFHLEDAPDGKATVTFTATDLRAIARWCMQFGDGIQVLEPQRLVDRIKQVGVAWGGKPVAAAPAPAPKPLPPPPPARAEREHRRDEHRRDESRRDEPRREHRDRDRDRDRDREASKEEPKGKGGKTEVRVERL
jgi:hypothetical protein